ncbi:MAG: UDP-N-acetylmuramate--L-alanine ligase, partial [Acidobacteria bacterium]|nr:UDP-N-acetylmuramate--L-alanine ligase [Acidobacteriota bacterium]
VIGGRLSAFGSNARLGRGDYMVVEADESDRSFLKLSPTFAVITNIDREHMESYGTWENMQQAFADFANKVPFYGALIACADDRAVRELLPRFTRRVITYGLADADVTGSEMQLEAFSSMCAVRVRRQNGRYEEAGALRLSVPGRHNVLNALGAVAVGLEVGIPFPKIVAALEAFPGAERRFQTLGEVDGVMVVDDYGHHPTEIAAVLAAAKAGVNRRVVAVFQPHRYSRTQQLMTEFGAAFGDADEIVLTDIYAAGEQPVDGITVDALAAAVRAGTRAPLHVVKALDELPAAVARLARRGDLVITLGAGSIGTVGERILAEIRATGPGRAAALDGGTAT